MLEISAEDGLSNQSRHRPEVALKALPTKGPREPSGEPNRLPSGAEEAGKGKLIDWIGLDWIRLAVGAGWE